MKAEQPAERLGQQRDVGRVQKKGGLRDDGVAVLFPPPRQAE